MLIAVGAVVVMGVFIKVCSVNHRGEISEACQQQEKCVSTAECHIGGVRKPMNM